ncbi:MAG TPA: glycosyltransferase family 2 protein [Steroidobacteraceae bacterium]|nr:glycosyltransferase family 2 protein [Steroidobacteraceae bacterium]
MATVIGRPAAAGSAAPLAGSLQREICATYLALTLTVAAVVLAFSQLSGAFIAELAARQWSVGVGQLSFMLIVALLIWGNFVYQLTRLGHLYRCAAHRPAAREELEEIYQRPAQPLAILVPSYREELGVVRCTLLSAALQEYPSRRVVLLIDDPVPARTAEAAAALAALRELPRRLQALFDVAATPFTEAERAFRSRCRRAPVNARHELDTLAQLYRQASRCVARCYAFVGGDSPAERLLVGSVLAPLFESHRRRSAELEKMTACSPLRLAREYRRLASLYAVSFTSFERKRYENLSHEPNKAMNLNSYLSLLGGRFREVTRGTRSWLVPAGDHAASLSVPAADFVITLDADSVLMPEYALRLVHRMCLPGNERVAVAQTPYSSIPAAAGSLEYVAGATTDVQYLIHQGFTAYGATFWVGANALLRVAALDDIKTYGRERGHTVVRYIQDRTVIEDTESSIDLIERGWTLQNYPERLAYSATPPDFGALLIQRRRWANGGLIILPKLLRHVLRAPRWPRLVEAYFRCHYLGSIAVVNLGLLLILAFPFDDRAESLWLPLTALPYFILYARDLVRSGYRWRDLASVYALNLLLIPINLGGVLKSLQQAITRTKIPFGRTPKVENRTRAPARYLLAEYLMLLAWSLGMVLDAAARRWTHAAFTACNTAFLGFAIYSYVGWSATVQDLRASWQSRPVPARPASRRASLAARVALRIRSGESGLERTSAKRDRAA